MSITGLPLRVGLACQACGANTTRGVSRQWRHGPGKNCSYRVLFLDFVSCPISMAPLLHWKIFLAFLSKLSFATDYAKRCLGRLSLFLAFLASRRKFSKWWHSKPGKPGTSQTVKPADPPFLGTNTNSYSVSGRATIVKQYTVAASSVPASASLPSLDERVERQTATAEPLAILPNDHVLKLITSEETPRYAKGVLMQVEHTILPPHPFNSLQVSRGDTL